MAGVCCQCGGSGGLGMCGRCKQVGYCSRACQTSHWADHKWVCSARVGIRASGVGAGLGVFALRAFDPGDELVEERPALKCGSALHQVAEAWARAAGAVQGRVVMGMTDAWCARDGGKPTLEGILATNSIPAGESEAGIFAIACRINHACNPNARWLWRHDLGMELVIALRPIRAGEEVTVCYAGDLAFCGSEERRAHLAEHLRFDCACTLCAAQSAESDARLCTIRDLQRKILRVHRAEPALALELCHQVLDILEAEGRRIPMYTREVHHNMGRIALKLGLRDEAERYAALALHDTRLTDGRGSPNAAALEDEIQRFYVVA